RRLALPAHPEVVIGAIGEDGVRLVDAALLRRAGATFNDFAAVARRERAVLDRRVDTLRAHRQPPDLIGQTVLVVDDGITTGATMSVASLVARKRGAAQVIAAAPVGSRAAVRRITGADQVVCLQQPLQLRPVAACYQDFPQTTAGEVHHLLGRRLGLSAS